MTSKIVKAAGAEPDGFEQQVAQAILELEQNSDFRAQLRELHITKAKEIEIFFRSLLSWQHPPSR